MCNQSAVDRIEVIVVDLAPEGIRVNGLFPAIAATGTMEVDLAVGGSLDAPRLQGSAHLTDVYF